MIGRNLKIEIHILRIDEDCEWRNNSSSIPRCPIDGIEYDGVHKIGTRHDWNHDAIYKLRWSMRTRWDIVNVRRWDVPEILRMISEPRNSVGSLNEFNVRSWKEKSMEPCRAFFKGPFPLKALERPRHLPNLNNIKSFYNFDHFILSWDMLYYFSLFVYFVFLL